MAPMIFTVKASAAVPTPLGMMTKSSSQAWFSCCCNATSMLAILAIVPVVLEIKISSLLLYWHCLWYNNTWAQKSLDCPECHPLLWLHCSISHTGCYFVESKFHNFDLTGVSLQVEIGIQPVQPIFWEKSVMYRYTYWSKARWYPTEN